uniref:Uncharacterized protein n=1 Tax=Arundo donax TaxID=35708 RepID=A0A0A8YQ02_ARUDO
MVGRVPASASEVLDAGSNSAAGVAWLMR